MMIGVDEKNKRNTSNQNYSWIIGSQGIGNTGSYFLDSVRRNITESYYFSDVVWRNDLWSETWREQFSPKGGKRGKIDDKQAHFARSRWFMQNQCSCKYSRRVRCYEERRYVTIPKLRLRRCCKGKLVGSSTVIRVFHSRIRAPILRTRRRMVWMLARLNGVCWRRLVLRLCRST